MVRRICLSIATAAVACVGVVGFTAPAQADSSWGYSMPPAHSDIR